MTGVTPGTATGRVRRADGRRRIAPVDGFFALSGGRCSTTLADHVSTRRAPPVVASVPVGHPVHPHRRARPFGRPRVIGNQDVALGALVDLLDRLSASGVVLVRALGEAPVDDARDPLRTEGLPYGLPVTR
ncbi:hypothetical protein GCM10010347_20140 [Streptomyces cirratus]|uniref:Uncharacterized protein n=1 Tax=Streptomyces cirratus TaxID=68187 RepID=A0ABQ3EPS9_9ACTN|nr:hypothetical protein GCM10010347_20140 [Streptomyces cirratus]